MDSAFNKDVVLIKTDAVPSKRLVSFMNSQFHLTHLNVNTMIQPCIVNNTEWKLEWKLRLDNFCQTFKLH